MMLQDVYPGKLVRRETRSGNLVVYRNGAKTDVRWICPRCSKRCSANNVYDGENLFVCPRCGMEDVL